VKLIARRRGTLEGDAYSVSRIWRSRAILFFVGPTFHEICRNYFGFMREYHLCIIGDQI
jgi:hypothetical protein